MKSAVSNSYQVESATHSYYPQVRYLRVPPNYDSGYVRFKYVYEYIIALMAFILISPFLLIIVIAIKVDSKGPVFFRHERHGLGGEKFTMLKFRTMYAGSHKLQKNLQNINEMNGGGLFKSDDDPRITRVGKFLRKYSIDELPQLINILRGEMTLIGPRPLSADLYHYKDEKSLKRFTVKPGLGCYWQAYFRDETDFYWWVETDRHYVESISFKTDQKLMFKILVNTIIGKGSR